MKIKLDITYFASFKCIFTKVCHLHTWSTNIEVQMQNMNMIHLIKDQRNIFLKNFYPPYQEKYL